MLTINDFKRLNAIKKSVEKLNPRAKGIIEIDFDAYPTDAYPCNFQVFMSKTAFYENFGDRDHEFHMYQFDKSTVVGVIIDGINYHCQVPNEEMKSGDDE